METLCPETFMEVIPRLLSLLLLEVELMETGLFPSPQANILLIASIIGSGINGNFKLRL